MFVEHLGNHIALQDELHRLGVDVGGIKILSDKGKLHLIRIRDLHVGAANILKQDALSIGADLAVPKGTVIASTPRVDVLLIANERQLQELSRKEKAQPFGLKDVAKKLEHFCRLNEVSEVQVMGVVNANDDSFYAHSRFNGILAIERIEKMIEEGASIIDIGAVSSRPGSKSVDEVEEFNRIKPILDLIEEQKLYEKTRLSLDSFRPSVIAYALERGFTLINDITGLSNDEVARLCGEYHAGAVIMHMQGQPETMQLNPSYQSMFDEIEQFFHQRIQKAESYGIQEIILDVGIGFGKRLDDNIALISHHKHFLSLGKPMLVGASRKSMIDQISPATTEERLPGTLALHLRAIEEGTSIIRVHDVKEHVQALKVYQALKNGHK